MEELIKKFTLEKVQASGAVFNVDKLNWMNNDYIKKYELDKLTELSLPYFQKAGFDVSNKELVKKILSAIRVYLNKLDDIQDHLKIFTQPEVELDNENMKEILVTDSSKKVFESLAGMIVNIETVSPENYKTSIAEVQKETGVKGKLLFKPVRVALTGSENGPELPVVAEILGKDKILRFLRRWIN